jgi:hypothetical protein
MRKSSSWSILSREWSSAMSFGVGAAGAVSNGMSGVVVVAAMRPPSKAMGEGGLLAREAGVHRFRK